MKLNKFIVTILTSVYFLMLCMLICFSVALANSNQGRECRDDNLPLNYIVPNSCFTNCLNGSNIEIVPQNNSTKVNFFISEISSILFDMVSVDATLCYHETVTRQVSKNVKYSEIIIDKDIGKFIVDFCNYGKFNVKIKLLNGTKVVKELDNQDVSVTADVYNIAPISGSLPVTSFLLSMWGDNSQRKYGPIFMFLERGSVLDWDKLPTASDDYFGCFACPYYNETEFKNHNSFYDKLDKFQDYVKSLKEISPNSKFNLFFNDINTGIANKIIYANNIENYSINYLSDGNWTYNDLNSTYNSDYNTNVSINNSKIAEWKNQELIARQTLQPTDFGINVWTRSNLYAVICADDCSSIQVTNKSLINTPNDGNQFGNEIRNNQRVKEKTIANLLQDNIMGDEIATRELKDLYKFNDDYFKKARELGKEVLLCLGKRADGERNLDEYILNMTLYYKERGNFYYYYKAHPATPPSESKIAHLESLGVENIESGVPAELVIFFNSDIKLCGYASSSFNNVASDMVSNMFNMNKKAGISSKVKAYNDCNYWISELGNCDNPAIQQLGSVGDFLVEFNDRIIQKEGYDFAIWDPVFGVAKYFRGNKDKYVLVKQEKGQGTGEHVSDGIYYIESLVNQRSVLDVVGGSKEVGANVQTYKANGTFAQKWAIRTDPQGYSTIVNLGSEKCLDVFGAVMASGTNVQQYTSNGTKAQKWKVYKQNGFIKFSSALNNNLVVDITGGGIADGTNVQIYSINDSNAQNFTLHECYPKVDPIDAGIENGVYKICSYVNKSKVLDISNKSYDNGGNIQIWDDLDEDYQKFNITRETDGFYRIVNVKTSKALDVDSGLPFDGINVQQWDSDISNKNQKWQINKVADSYTFVNVASGLTMDLFGCSTDNGTNIDVYSSNGTAAQIWNVIKTETSREKLDKLANKYKDVLTDKSVYKIGSILNNNYVIDDNEASHDDGSNIAIYRDNRTNAQKWKAIHDKCGYVTFINIESGKVLDVYNANSISGTNVQQWTSNGSYAQKWIVVPIEKESFRIVSALDEHLVLDLCGGLVFNSSNIQVYADNGSKAQSWMFSKIV